MARKALGKGLRALIPEAETPEKILGEQNSSSASSTQEVRSGTSLATATQAPVADGDREQLAYLPIAAIMPNQNQPRVDLDPVKLEGLTRSILENGLLEPIIVRPLGSGYELVAGERRWRACSMAGWTEVPALVRTLEVHESLETALVENLQRADLNPVEEARAYQKLITQYGRTHDEIARRVGKDRSTVTNLLRILKLPGAILEHVSRGTLTVGHVRVLLAVPDDGRIPLAERIIREKWSVRDLEAWVSREDQSGEQKRRARRSRRGARKSDHMRQIEEDLCRHFGTQTRIRLNRQGGRVEIAFHDEEELSRLLDLFGIVVV